MSCISCSSFGSEAGTRSPTNTRCIRTAVFTLARVCAALLGTLAVWLLYAAGARLFDRGVALLAAALEAVAFLPVFYAHLALNDAATLLPLTLSLFGSAGVLRYGRLRDYAIAGLGLGFACATKYTAGIVLVPLLAAAAAVHYLDGSSGAGKRVLVGIVLAGGCALGAFLLANPYALLDFQRFHSGPRPPVESLRGSPGQARRATPGGAALLPVVVYLGSRLGARRGSLAAAR